MKKMISGVIIMAAFLTSCSGTGPSNIPPRADPDMQYVQNIGGYYEQLEMLDFIKSLPDDYTLRSNAVLVDGEKGYFLTNVADDNTQIAYFGPDSPYIIPAYAGLYPQILISDKQCPGGSGPFVRTASVTGAVGSRMDVQIPKDYEVDDYFSAGGGSRFSKYHDAAFIYTGGLGSKGTSVDVGLQHVSDGWMPFFGFYDGSRVDADSSKNGFRITGDKIKLAPGTQAHIDFDVTNVANPKNGNNYNSWYLVLTVRGQNRQGQGVTRVIGFKTKADDNTAWSNPQVPKLTDWNPRAGGLNFKAMVSLGQLLPKGVLTGNSPSKTKGSLFNMQLTYSENGIAKAYKDWTPDKDQYTCKFPLNGRSIEYYRQGTSLSATIETSWSW